MARPKNKVATEQITISTNTVLCADLDKVVQTGYYGNTRPEAAERLITEAIRQLIQEGSILKKKKVIQL
jgi:hypothetical protein